MNKIKNFFFNSSKMIKLTILLILLSSILMILGMEIPVHGVRISTIISQSHKTLFEFLEMLETAVGSTHIDDYSVWKQLYLSRTAVAGFSFFMISIASIGWVIFLKCKKL